MILDIEAAASGLGVSPRTIRSWQQRGLIERGRLVDYSTCEQVRDEMARRRRAGLKNLPESL